MGGFHKHIHGSEMITLRVVVKVKYVWLCDD